MKMNHIKVRGAIGFKRGLGVDEVEFDLRDKTGLVALSGPNGRGKTTMLELMSPYRTFASRSGALRHHFFLRNSFIETSFEYNGKSYETIRKIDSGSDRAEAFILVDGESAVNGKLKEYDNFIIDLFGSQALFYNSVFCAQGSGNMSDMRTGEIKELFVEFLRIERLVEYETKAKAGITFFQKKYDILSGQIEVLEESVTFFKNLDVEIKNKTDEVEGVEVSIKSQKEYLKMVNENINKLRLEEVAQAADREKKKEIEKKLTAKIAERDAVKLKVETIEDAMHVKVSELQHKVDDNNLILNDKEKILAASSRIEKLKRGETHFLDCIECSMDEQAKLAKRMEEMRTKSDEFADQIEAFKNDLVTDGLQTTLSWISRTLFDIGAEQEKSVRELASLENDFVLIQAEKDVMLCKEKISLAIDPDCTSTICPAIQLVNDAVQELPGREKIFSDLKAINERQIALFEKMIAGGIERANGLNRRRDVLTHCLDEHLLEINKQIDRLDRDRGFFKIEYIQAEADRMMTDEFKEFYRKKLNAYREKILNLEGLAAKRTQIEVAEEKGRNLEAERARITSERDEKVAELSGSFEALAGQVVAYENKIEEIESGLSKNDIPAWIKKKETERDRLMGQQDALSTKLDRLKQSLAILENDLVKKNENMLIIESKKEEVKKIQVELSEWDYLRLACSKTGLQALEIDGAAPLIVSEANALLEHAFGLDSQVRIVTQDPESGREVFWIKVIREDGSEDDFGNLSGGQKVWIAKALSLGMTLVSKRKSGRNLMTLFADEEDGALDSEKALEFIQLYRSMMATGDFETCFFISHNPDVVAMSDHEIKF